MVKATLSAIMSLFMPGAGHMLVNFQFLKGLFIMIGYLFIVLPLFFATVLIGFGFILIPIIHIIVAFWSYTDAKKK